LFLLLAPWFEESDFKARPYFSVLVKTPPSPPGYLICVNSHAQCATMHMILHSNKIGFIANHRITALYNNPIRPEKADRFSF
jgi:hypothetical protein